MKDKLKLVFFAFYFLLAPAVGYWIGESVVSARYANKWVRVACTTEDGKYTFSILYKYTDPRHVTGLQLEERDNEWRPTPKDPLSEGIIK